MSKRPPETPASLMPTVRKAAILVRKGYPLNWIANKLTVERRQVFGWKNYYQWKPKQRIRVRVKPPPPPPAPKLPTKKELYKLAQQQKQHNRENERNQVKKLLDAGSSQAAVRVALNLSYGRFNSHLKQLGIETQQRVMAKKRFMAENLYELADEPPDQIDKELALPPGTTAYWITQYKWTNHETDAVAQRKHKARQLYEVQGMQQKEIAKQCGVSERTLCNWKKRFQWKRPGQ